MTLDERIRKLQESRREFLGVLERKVRDEKLRARWKKKWAEFYDASMEANPEVRDVYARAEWVRKACERTVCDASK